MPSTTALGHSGRRWRAVCTSPFGSLKVTSATSSLGRVSGGRSFSVKLRRAAARRSSAGSLSATSAAAVARGLFVVAVLGAVAARAAARSENSS